MSAVGRTARVDVLTPAPDLPGFLKSKIPRAAASGIFRDQLLLFVRSENQRDELFLLYAIPFFSWLI